ncbi:hypothetical protein G6L37_34925 [Agrobacterium rubi]|nr:hypothetical protein [Agrobacterium rubi]NTF23763.1 hypothetical protein [Agrobacterium rubi]
MPSGIVRGLPDEDVAFLMRAVGGFGRIEAVNSDNTIEVELKNRAGNRIHYVWLGSADLEFIGRGVRDDVAYY